MEPWRSYYDLVPFEIIAEAVGGGTESLQYIASHYDAYMKKLSTSLLNDDMGLPYLFFDYDLYECLNIRLITRTLAFKLDY